MGLNPGKLLKIRIYTSKPFSRSKNFKIWLSTSLLILVQRWQLFPQFSYYITEVTVVALASKIHYIRLILALIQENSWKSGSTHHRLPVDPKVAKIWSTKDLQIHTSRWLPVYSIFCYSSAPPWEHSAVFFWSKIWNLCENHIFWTFFVLWKFFVYFSFFGLYLVKLTQFTK